MRTLIRLLPEWARFPLRRMNDLLSAVRYRGEGRFCPVCGRASRRFRPYGRVPRQDAQCVHCGALERHRLVWIFLSQKTDLFDGRPRSMLHVAPEPSLEARFRERLGGSYLTADLAGSRAMVRMDITHIEYADGSFDVIYCSHVLEHVPDDRRAMREFHRVLKADGWAILLVPITAGSTFEDPAIVDPAERRKHFGQEDHVRRYGPDFADRLQEAGFTVRVIRPADLVTPQEAVRMGLVSCGDIYFCRKAAASRQPGSGGPYEFPS